MLYLLRSPTDLKDPTSVIASDCESETQVHQVLQATNGNHTSFKTLFESEMGSTLRTSTPYKSRVLRGI